LADARSAWRAAQKLAPKDPGVLAAERDLDEAEAKRQADQERSARVTELKSRVTDALDRQALDDVEPALAQLRALDADNPDVGALAARAQALREQLARDETEAAAEADRLRRVQALVTQAEAARARQAYDDEAVALNEAIGLAPERVDVKDALAVAKEAIRQAKKERQLQEARQRRIDEAVAQVREALVGGRLPAARSAWQAASKLAKDDPAVLAIGRELETAEAEEKAAREAAPPPGRTTRRTRDCRYPDR
jgi:hypothetical protein